MRQIIANLALFIFSFNLLLFEGKEIKADESGVKDAVNITASDIIEKKPTPEHVRIIGYIIGDLGDTRYLFSDSTDEIIVNIPNEYFPYPYKITNEDKIEIAGQIIWENQKQPVIHVDFFNVIN